MPKAVEGTIARSVRRAHPNYSEKRVDKETYSTMNKLGLLHNRAGGPERFVPKGKYVHALLLVAVILVIAHFIGASGKIGAGVSSTAVSAPGSFGLGVNV